MRSLPALLLLAVVGLAPPLSAQESSLARGDKVRLVTDHGETMVGRWERASADSIWLMVGTWTTPLDRSAVRSVEQSAGVQSQFKAERALLITASFGVVGGVIGGASGPCEPTGFLSCLMAPTTRKGAIQLGAGVGLAVGLVVAIVASRERNEVWRPVPGVGTRAASLEVRPVVGSQTGVAFTFRPGR
jgi:hypothetical protein